jgi:hypothetical protein
MRDIRIVNFREAGLGGFPKVNSREKDKQTIA